MKPNSSVLEFGPAQGQMTQFMKEVLNCVVTIVEIDEEAAAFAAHYAEKTIICDIESMEWEKEIIGQQFDCIIFADVIEHLKDPTTVLLHAKHFLKYGGSMFISTPNIAHNSVLINLFRNKFQYTKTGILDDTHVKLFTRFSLHQLFEDTKLYPVKCFATYSKPGENEIDSNYETISSISPYFWKCRKFGCVYQYIYELKKNFDVCTTYEDHVREILPEYFISIYGSDTSSEDIKYKMYLDLENLEQEVNVSVPTSLQAQNKLTIVLLNTPAVVEILEGYVICDGEKTGIYVSHHNADEVVNNKYFFATNIPSIEIETNISAFEQIYLHLKYSDVENVLAIQERIHDLRVLRAQFDTVSCTSPEEAKGIIKQDGGQEVEDYQMLASKLSGDMEKL